MEKFSVPKKKKRFKRREREKKDLDKLRNTRGRGIEVSVRQGE